MDGDAANVPLKWLKAVFMELENLLDEPGGKQKRLFSISVLGVQSSGKSTFLNTMLGLQFPVSVGRCTRGIFLQLVRVDRDRSSLPFDYVMVIDTEGLRAPGMAGEKIHHDNELATLIIGLADVAIINIKGETIADMQDIMQIVVHGLIKLKQANHKLEFSQTGILVHQNVCAQDAKEKLMQDNKKNIDVLNKITAVIAEQEKVSGVRSFKDVIEFDFIDHVKYIPDLWNGSPPMAPASCMYSEEVTRITKLIMKDIVEKKKRYMYQSVSNTFLHIESLWKGIMAEDFLLGFRNCVEIKAYHLLEDEYQQNVFALENFKLFWWKENVDYQINICTSEIEVHDKSRDLIQDFTIKIAEESNRLVNKLTKFVKESELSAYMVNWIQGKKGSFKTKTDLLRNGVIDKIKREERKRILCVSKETHLYNTEKQIHKRAKELANSLKGQKVDVETMKSKFNILWTQLFTEIVKDSNDETPAAKKDNIKKWMTTKLYETYAIHKTLIDNGLEEKSLTDEEQKDNLENSLKKGRIEKHDIEKNTFNQKAKEKRDCLGEKSPQFILQAHGIANQILSSIDSYLCNLLKTDVEIDDTHFSVVLNIINREFKQHNEGLKEFQLTNNFLIKVVLHVSRFSFNVFCKHNQDYQEKNSLEQHFVAFKNDAWIYFADIFTSKTEEIVAGNLLCRAIELMIRSTIEKQISGVIVMEIKSKFNNKKHKLMISILEALAEMDRFEEYEKFILSPADYAIKWITKKTDEDFFGKNSQKYLQYTRQHLQSLIKDVKNIISAMAQQTDIKTMKEWITRFLMLAGKKKLITSHSFDHVADCEVKYFEDFQTAIFTQLNNIEQKLANEFANQTADTIKWEYETPYMEIFQLWGCTACCPWCGEPCQDSDPDHSRDHQCIQHRPEGMKGARNKDTGIIDIDTCNYFVQSHYSRYCGTWCECPDRYCEKRHPCKSYRDYMKKWYIAPLANKSKVGYWNWVFGKYYEKFASHFGCKKPDSIPSSWKNMTKEAAVNSLYEYM